jgi:hypothetical protein
MAVQLHQIIILAKFTHYTDVWHWILLKEHPKQNTSSLGADNFCEVCGDVLDDFCRLLEILFYM